MTWEEKKYDTRVYVDNPVDLVDFSRVFAKKSDKGLHLSTIYDFAEDLYSTELVNTVYKSNQQIKGGKKDVGL